MRVYSARAIASRSKKLKKTVATKAEVLTSTPIPKGINRARKVHIKPAKALTQGEIGTIGTGWVVHQQDGEAHVVYSDVLGITHKSLEDDAICGVSDASEGVEKKTSSTRLTRASALREHGPRGEMKLAALWNAKRGANYVRAMHNIQQARPRSLSK